MIGSGTLPYRIFARSGLILIRVFESLVVLARGNRTYYPNAEFPWIADLEAQTPLMQKELRALLSSDRQLPEFKEISEEQARITEGVWKTHIFYAYGGRWESNCQTCPETARILESIPGMTSGMFSILAPGAHLTPHRGPFKGVLRYHLGLIVPADADACGIRVGQEVAHWREGASLVFDDTHEHEAWNLSEETRVVLFVDFLRDLPFPLGFMNRGMVRLIGASPFVQNMVARFNEMSGRVSDVK